MILRDPANKIIKSLTLFLSDKIEKGIENITATRDIENMVPIEKDNKINIPEKIFSVSAISVKIIAPLQAKPCITHIT